jgi:hypothetical protein
VALPPRSGLRAVRLRLSEGRLRDVLAVCNGSSADRQTRNTNARSVARADVDARWSDSLRSLLEDAVSSAYPLARVLRRTPNNRIKSSPCDAFPDPFHTRRLVNDPAARCVHIRHRLAQDAHSARVVAATGLDFHRNPLAAAIEHEIDLRTRCGAPEEGLRARVQQPLAAQHILDDEPLPTRTPRGMGGQLVGRRDVEQVVQRARIAQIDLETLGAFVSRLPTLRKYGGSRRSR